MAHGDWFLSISRRIMKMRRGFSRQSCDGANYRAALWLYVLPPARVLFVFEFSRPSMSD